MKNTIFSKIKKDLKLNKSLYILVLPVLIFYIIFHYKPMYGAVIAFMDYNPSLGIKGSDWVGFAQFKSEYQGGYILPEAKERELTHAHSNVMHMLAECGAVGFLALLFFWGTWILQRVRIWSTTHEIAALIAAAVVMGLILQGLTEYNMGNSAVMKLHWLLLGLCLQWGRLDGIKRIR